MKNIVFAAMLLLLSQIAFSQSVYRVTDGSDSKFKAKYKLTTVMDDKKHVLHVTTTAALQYAMLTVYTPEELAVRKGREITKMSPGKTFSFDLNGAGNKDQHTYWLMVYPTDMPMQEILFTRSTKAAPGPSRPATPAKEPGTVNNGAVTIKTNITCEAGKIKVNDALREMDGVFDVNIDIRTGKLLLNFSSDGTSLNDIIELINANGFDANGKKSTNVSANPCRKNVKD